MKELLDKEAVLKLFACPSTSPEVIENEIRHMELANQWHPASEEPPTPNEVTDEDVDFGTVYVWHESDKLLVKLENGMILVGMYIKDDPCSQSIWVNEYNYDTLEHVSAWMEL